MSLSLKWNEQILESPSVLNFFICSHTENSPFLIFIGPCRKAKITEIRFFLTPITAKRNNTILYHGTRENKLQTTQKIKTVIPDLSNANGFPCSICSGVFVFIIRAVFPGASLRCWSFASLSRRTISKLGYSKGFRRTLFLMTRATQKEQAATSLKTICESCWM